MSKLYVVSTGRNASKFVLNCVQSVKKQTLKPERHIVIDDMSDDDTRMYLDRVARFDKNVEVIFNTERKYRLKMLSVARIITMRSLSRSTHSYRKLVYLIKTKTLLRSPNWQDQ